METPHSFRDIIALWPTRAALARDLKDLGGATKTAPIIEWDRTDSIPTPWFDALIKAAEARGFVEITYRALAALTRARRERRHPRNQ